MILVQVGLAGDAIEDLVRPDKEMGAVAGVLEVAGPEATPGGDVGLLGTDPGGGEPLAQDGGEGLLALPAAADTAADEDFALGHRLGRAVQHAVQQRLAAQDVLGEDIVDGLAVHPLVLHRHLPGDQHADDGLAAAAASAAGAVEEDVGAAGSGHVVAEFGRHVVGPGGLLAGGRADLDADRAGLAAAADASSALAARVASCCAIFGGAITKP